MAADLWPYSQRLSGAVTDSEHEALWTPIADGILPNEPSTALAVSVSSGSWVVQPGRMHIAGHVLNIDDAVSGTLPAGSTSTRRSVVVAYVNRTTSPWTWGIKLVQGTPGAGRPSLSTSTTGEYQVALRAFDTATSGSTTLLADERVFLTPVGGDLVTPWTNLALASGYKTYDVTPQYRVTTGGRRLELRGTIAKTNNAAIDGTTGPTLLTLPTEVRPANTLQRFTAQTTLTGPGTSGTARVDVSGTGAIRLWTQDAPTWVGIFGYIWLD